MNEYPIAVRYLIRFLLAFAIITTLVLTKPLLAPLFLSILFAYMLYPPAEWLEKKGLHRIPTNFLLIIGALAIVGGIVFLIAVLFASFTEDLPQIQQQMERNLSSLQSTIGGWIGVSEWQQDNAIKNAIGNTGQYLGRFFSATANTVLTVTLIPVYTFLILFYRDKVRTFISKLVSPDQKEVTQTIIDQTEEIVPQYMKGLFIVCFILVGINSLGFYIVGVKYALLMGIIAALFNLIPYLGTVIGYGIVLLFVMATQSSAVALGVVVQFFIVQFTENNILTPNITGSYVRINPLVTIFSLIAGGMIWGLPGMFIVIPYLAMMKIFCENIESLKPIGYLLGTRGTDGHSLHFNFFSDK